MGLDISLQTDKSEELFHLDIDDFFALHSLSRTFCNFICRHNVIDHTAELDQIGALTGIDISPLYEMESYWEDEDLENALEFADDESDMENIQKKADDDNRKVEGNIHRVSDLINNLIAHLGSINNVNKHLIPTEFDTLNNNFYFSDFNTDKGDGYIGNNFGQDLRNFQRFLVHSIECGANTVWFRYS